MSEVVKAWTLIGRLAIGWATVTLFLFFGERWLADINFAQSALLFAWLFGVILWCAFGVVKEAEHLAEILREPLGTLILTLSIVIIEVVLIAAMALGGKSAPTLGRDMMFAVLMIVLNAAVGLCLLLGGLRHHAQAHNLQGAVAYLAVIIPLSVIALILPDFTHAVPIGSVTLIQGAFFSLFTVLLYGIYILDGMRENGWVPVRAQEQSIRIEARRGFQKHIVRFARAEHLQTWETNKVRPEVVLVNSHDKSSDYQLHCGLFRLVYTNGMVVSDGTFERISIKH